MSDLGVMKMLYRADIIYDGPDGNFKGKEIKVLYNYQEFIDEICKFIDEYENSNPELWSAQVIFVDKKDKEEQGILIKTLTTIKTQKGEDYAKKLNKVHAGKIT